MTKKNNPSPFFRFIEDLYEQEQMAEYHEVCQRTVTFNFPAEDACMFAAIAKRFGRSTAAFGGDVFAEHVRELFIALSPEDRRKLAFEADSEHSRYLESKGFTSSDADGNPQPPGFNHWQHYADICDRVEVEQEGQQ